MPVEIQNQRNKLSTKDTKDTKKAEKLYCVTVTISHENYRQYLIQRCICQIFYFVFFVSFVDRCFFGIYAREMMITPRIITPMPTSLIELNGSPSRYQAATAFTT